MAAYSVFMLYFWYEALFLKFALCISVPLTRLVVTNAKMGLEIWGSVKEKQTPDPRLLEN